MIKKLKSHYDRLVSPTKVEKTTEPKPEEKRSVPENPDTNPYQWIGVDLDGTLAEYTSWRGIKHIGKPVPLMKRRVDEWIESGLTVKIFTARASVPEGIPPIKKWLEKHGFPELEITNQKDFNMLEAWDDRAIQVIANTGKPILRHRLNSKPKAPILKDEKSPTTCETVAPPEKDKH